MDPELAETELRNSKITFGFIEVFWKINHYTMATLRSCNIVSPEFYVRGPQTTKWQLILFPHSVVNGKQCIELQLKRICIMIPGDKVVWAEFKMSLKNNKEKKLGVQWGQGFIQENLVSVSFNVPQQILHDLLPFDSDTLQVQCVLIVSHVEFTNSFERSSCIGLKFLSRDLFNLYKLGTYSDIVIRINDKFIRAHKAILQSRSFYFKSLIEKDVRQYVYDFSNLNYDAVDKILSYLYSGKLEFVLGKPSVSIYDCILCFKIEELLQYYESEKLNLNSEVKVEEIAYVWHIQKFKTTIQNQVLSQNLVERVSQMTLCIELCLKYGNGYVYLTFIAHILRGRIGQIVCLKLQLLDKILCFCIKIEDMENHQLELIRLDYEELLKNPAFVNDSLSINIQVRICDTEATWKHMYTPSSVSFAQ